MARLLPHLVVLQEVFDRTVELAQLAGDGSDIESAARATGAWMAAEIGAELNLREMSEGFAAARADHVADWKPGFDTAATDTEPARGESLVAA